MCLLCKLLDRLRMPWVMVLLTLVGLGGLVLIELTSEMHGYLSGGLWFLDTMHLFHIGLGLAVGSLLAISGLVLAPWGKD